MGYATFIIVCVLIVAVIFIEGAVRDKRGRLAYRQQLKDTFGKEKTDELSRDAIDKISLYHKSVKSEATGRFCIDDITWNDLSMDEVFSKMDTCLSVMGEEQLYHRLHCPTLTESDDDHKHFVDMRKYYETHEDERTAIQEIMHDIGINRKTSITTVFNYVSSLEPESNTGHYMTVALMILAILMVFALPAAGVLLLLGVMIYAIASYLKKKKEIDPVIVTFNYTARMLRAIEKLNRLESSFLREDMARLNELRAPLKGILAKSVWLTSGSASMDNPAMLLEEYIKMFFHIDLIIINRLIRLLKSEKAGIDEIRSILGNIDASIAAGSYRLSLAGSCEPEFTDSCKAGISIEGCIHPLVAEPVPNSIDAQGPILLTGSNASGKSTFLKAVAISALLAQTVGYVPASSYKGNRFKIFTSMALNDSILNGESYFIVEIKSLKRILDACDEGTPILCCIDEVLRGTNTVERIAASTQILKSLATDICIPFAATHDIELTHILEGIYSNYHFAEEVTADDVKFSYRLNKGRAQSRNAIRLLQVMDYDQRIIDVADAMVEAFTEKGTWV